MSPSCSSGPRCGRQRLGVGLNHKLVDPDQYACPSNRGDALVLVVNLGQCEDLRSILKGFLERNGYGSKFNNQGTAGLSAWFHLAGQPILGTSF